MGRQTEEPLMHALATSEETASVRWKPSQKKCSFVLAQGFPNGMHVAVPFSHELQHEVLVSLKPTHQTSCAWLASMMKPALIKGKWFGNYHNLKGFWSHHSLANSHDRVRRLSRLGWMLILLASNRDHCWNVIQESLLPRRIFPDPFSTSLLSMACIQWGQVRTQSSSWLQVYINSAVQINQWR